MKFENGKIYKFKAENLNDLWREKVNRNGAKFKITGVFGEYVSITFLNTGRSESFYIGNIETSVEVVDDLNPVVEFTVTTKSIATDWYGPFFVTSSNGKVVIEINENRHKEQPWTLKDIEDAIEVLENLKGFVS